MSAISQWMHFMVSFGTVSSDMIEISLELARDNNMGGMVAVVLVCMCHVLLGWIALNTFVDSDLASKVKRIIMQGSPLRPDHSPLHMLITVMRRQHWVKIGVKRHLRGMMGKYCCVKAMLGQGWGSR